MNVTLLLLLCVSPNDVPTSFAVASWEASLQEALSGCTVVRVRTGGTCHRNEQEERTLFRITGHDEIERIIAGIKIDEERSGAHCMCCGEPTFEFYEDDKLLVMLGYHHGQSLRWADGEWKGDAMLVRSSASSLAKWLAEHGVTRPLEDLRKKRQREKAARRRFSRYLSILPDSLKSELKSARSPQQFTETLENFLPDETERMILLLELFGCDHGSWNSHNCLDEFLVEQIGAMTPSVFWMAAQHVQDDPNGLCGAARWIIVEADTDKLDHERLGPLLQKLARVGLSHPRDINRERTVAFLDKVGSPATKAILRQCLDGSFREQPLPPEEKIEPGGMVTFWPRDEVLTENCSAQAYAAIVLARTGDSSIRQTVETLSLAASEEDQVLYQKALAILRRAAE